MPAPRARVIALFLHAGRPGRVRRSRGSPTSVVRPGFPGHYPPSGSPLPAQGYSAHRGVGRSLRPVRQPWWLTGVARCAEGECKSRHRLRPVSHSPAKSKGPGTPRGPSRCGRPAHRPGRLPGDGASCGSSRRSDPARVAPDRSRPAPVMVVPDLLRGTPRSCQIGAAGLLYRPSGRDFPGRPVFSPAAGGPKETPVRPCPGFTDGGSARRGTRGGAADRQGFLLSPAKREGPRI